MVFSNNTQFIKYIPQHALYHNKPALLLSFQWDETFPRSQQLTYSIQHPKYKQKNNLYIVYFITNKDRFFPNTKESALFLKNLLQCQNNLI